MHDGGEVLAFLCRVVEGVKTVQCDDRLFRRGKQFFDQMAADEAGSAGYQDGHGDPFIRFSTTKEPTQAEPQDDAQRRERLGAIDLGRAMPAVFKDNGRFADAATCLTAPIEHFFLKGISARDHPRKVNLLEALDAMA